MTSKHNNPFPVLRKKPGFDPKMESQQKNAKGNRKTVLRATRASG